MPETLMTKNDFCHYTGITQETLRHYVENGIIRPKRNKDNGYKLYSLSDAALLMTVREMRGFDIPLREIEKTVASNSGEGEYRRFLMEKREDIRARITELKRRLEITDTRIAALEDADRIQLRFYQKTYFAFYDGTPAMGALVQKLQSLLPITNIAIRIPYDEEAGTRVAVGFAISESYLKLLEEDDLRLMTCAGSTRLLVLKNIDDPDNLSLHDFDDILQYMEQHRFTPLSDLYCIVQYAYRKNGKTGCTVYAGFVIED